MRASIERAKRDPSLLLLFTLIATFVYFFGWLHLFTNGRLSTWTWAWQAWNPETNYEHAKIIPLIVAFLIWYDRDKLKNAPLGSSRWGWAFIAVGLFLFLAGARTLQARLTLTALPVLLLGVVLYVWGKAVARVLLFPIAFLLFMVPLNFLTQSTFKLQFVETGIASAVCNLIGIHVNTIGTLVNSNDNAFHFQVDEGCSGIRSLMAIAMFSAIYGHLTQNKLWKKLAIFAAALLFAVIGNAGRLISVFIVGRFFGQDLAGGPYHAVAGFISFACAFVAMVLFGKLLNIKLPPVKQAASSKEAPTYDY
ncbi:MAG TPA: exosortase/archaeosortase family protein [Chthoniobacterales bacterium]|nr:exosortase/archaeosortase family protein [Chthoniobacterales bacterium]